MNAMPRRSSFSPPCPLTPRQIEVLQWVAEGKTAAEIATILGISWHTSTKHIDQAKTAAGVNKETALVATALRQGWIQ